MTTINVLQQKPNMIEGVPFNASSFHELADAFNRALGMGDELLGMEADVNAIIVKAVDTGRDIDEYMISIFSTRGCVSIVVPSNESSVIAWKS